MSRWIDVDALIDALEYDIAIDEDILNAIELLLRTPSIDLVRCGECRHKRLYDGETKYYYCALEDRPNRQWSVDDWNYCYWGERKESE